MNRRPNFGETQITDPSQLYEGLELIWHCGVQEHPIELTSDPYEISTGILIVEFDYLNQDATGVLHLSQCNVILNSDGTWHATDWLEDINR